MTDQAPLVNLLQTNVELNNLGRNVTVKELSWHSLPLLHAPAYVLKVPNLVYLIIFEQPTARENVHGTFLPYDALKVPNHQLNNLSITMLLPP